VTKAQNPLLDDLWILFTRAQGEVRLDNTMKMEFMAECWGCIIRLIQFYTVGISL